MSAYVEIIFDNSDNRFPVSFINEADSTNDRLDLVQGNILTKDFIFLF